jgi:hypothetical protein
VCAISSKPFQSEREMRAALARNHDMDFIDDNARNGAQILAKQRL